MREYCCARTIDLFRKDVDVNSVAISPDGKYIVSGSWDRSIGVWDLKTGKMVRRLIGHKKMVTSVTISKDGKYIVSGSLDKTVKIWELEKGKLVQALKGHVTRVMSVAISSDGKYIVSGGGLGLIHKPTIKIWKLEEEN